jgi:hypothetical protein
MLGLLLLRLLLRLYRRCFSPCDLDRDLDREGLGDRDLVLLLYCLPCSRL